MDLRQRRGLIGQKESDVRLPRAYQEVEWIQGRIVVNAAYIDTLYIPTVYTKLRVKFVGDQQNQSGYFGARNDPFRFYCATFETGNKISCGLTKGSWPSTRLNMNYGAVYDCFIANGQSQINETIIYTSVISESDWSDDVGTIQLWSKNPNTQFSPGATAKYYLCQIWENDVLVRDFVPCYRKADGEIGMYELVAGEFYTNAGVGSFTKGADV